MKVDGPSVNDFLAEAWAGNPCINTRKRVEIRSRYECNIVKSDVVEQEFELFSNLCGYILLVFMGISSKARYSQDTWVPHMYVTVSSVIQ